MYHRLLTTIFIVGMVWHSGPCYANTTIYLVRHAEKLLDPTHNSDPQLTVCGQQRARRLADILQDIKLEAVYSTDWVRTRDTARPSSETRALDIQLYDPEALEAFATKLKHDNRNALVVGHSNTTPLLAGLLVNRQWQPLNENVYDHLYQVTISDTGADVLLLHQAFVCAS